VPRSWRPPLRTAIASSGFQTARGPGWAASRATWAPGFISSPGSRGRATGPGISTDGCSRRKKRLDSSCSEQVTRPLDEDGPERLTGTPLVVDLGPGGFFLVRVPEELWASLDLAYGQVSVLDENGKVIERMCRYLGSSPLSPLAGVYLLAGGPSGWPDRGSHDAYPCPATGSYLDDASLRLAPPRSAEFGPFTGRDVVSGQRIALSSFSGRPLVLAVAQPATETGMRFLRELSTFARRHPETHVVVVVEGSQSSALKSEEVSLVDAVASLETPIPVLTGDFPWPLDRHLVVALDPNGRARAELRPPRNDLYMYEVVTQDLLDELLSRATSE
jgi:hypothetical protein